MTRGESIPVRVSRNKNFSFFVDRGEEKKQAMNWKERPCLRPGSKVGLYMFQA